jgi:predicted nucleic acid-binding protein
VATAVLVDSNVILDAATDDPRWGAWSAEILASVADESILVINPLIYAEVSVHFDSIEELNEVLSRRSRTYFPTLEIIAP